MVDLKLRKIDSVYMKVEGERSTLQELSDVFTFMVPGAKFTPAFRNKFWDGKIRLLSLQTGLIYCGLISDIKQFSELRGYELEIDKQLEQKNDITDEHLVKFIQKINPKHNPRDYQYEALQYCLTNKRCVLLSPTGSGKSLIIYLISRFFNMMNKKVLLIVPTISLTRQMDSDFVDYNHGESLDTHLITAGVQKDEHHDITVTTWQSIYKMPPSWFERFDCVIADECHQYKSKSLSGILEKCKQIDYRFGFTGTLDGENVNKLVLMGLFGEVKRVASTTELMENKQLSNLKIKCLVLNYPDEDRKLCKKKSYQEEIDFIVGKKERNEFVVNLVKNLKGGTLVLFRYIDHGKKLFEMIKEFNSNTYYVSGEVDGQTREEIRKFMDEVSDENKVLVGSIQTLGTGINIKRIDNIVFVSPTKSKITTLQSIGRGLRLNENKIECVLYDIIDNLQVKNNQNFTLRHFKERVKIYDSEGFYYKLYQYDI